MIHVMGGAKRRGKRPLPGGNAPSIAFSGRRVRRRTTVDNFRGRTPVSLNDLVYGLINLVSAIVNSL
ncbi:MULTISPECIES: hypothetical protein [Amycolatopsis]|uniref:hypothetical protein n=1 Tax=Amycolatopsis TaxID=1813 RepID=UPI0012F74227|nr:hypothetical protein [Amycolatopsis thermoflava]